VSEFTSEFNTVDSLLMGSDVPTEDCSHCSHAPFTGTWQQFWPDALPTATNNSQGYQQAVFQITSKCTYLRPQKVPNTSKFWDKNVSKCPEFPELRSKFKCWT